MSILLVKDGLGIGGSELQLLLLAQGLTSGGEQVSVVNLSKPAQLAPRLHASGVGVVAMARASRFDPTPIVRLARHIRQTRPAVVHSFHWLANLYSALAIGLLPRTTRPRRVGSLRSHYYLGAKGRQRALIDRATAARMDVMVANCRALLCHAQKHRVQWKNTAVIYNGVIVPSHVASPRVDVEVRFVSLGRLAAPKQPRDILLAAAHVPQAAVWFVGDGPERPDVQRLTDTLGLTQRVRFFGPLDEPMSVLQQADVLVLASAHEGLPNAVIEGMAAGLPVLATDVGGISEVVEHGRNGFLVPPGRPEVLADAMTRLVTTPELRHSMALRSRQLAVEGFSAETMVRGYERLYASLAPWT
jgi:glycosyltransferase involved in cell wall biosynthesis